MVKKVTFEARRPTQPTPAPTDAVDNWVEARAPERIEPTKRLTIDVPISLHRRIKSQCALQNLVMAEEIRSLLEKRFPPAGEGARREYDEAQIRLHDDAAI